MQQRVRGGVVGTRTQGINRRAIKSGDTGPSLTPHKAGSNPAPSPIYKSKWEASYSAKLELEKKAGLIKAYWYEPFSLWLPGKVRYRPDFLVQYEPMALMALHQPIRGLEVIEVKGWSPNRRDGITRLKIAAAMFPCFVWRMVWMKKGGHFDGEYI